MPRCCKGAPARVRQLRSKAGRGIPSRTNSPVRLRITPATRKFDVRTESPRCRGKTSIKRHTALARFSAATRTSSLSIPPWKMIRTGSQTGIAASDACLPRLSSLKSCHVVGRRSCPPCVHANFICEGTAKLNKGVLTLGLSTCTVGTPVPFEILPRGAIEGERGHSAFEARGAVIAQVQWEQHQPLKSSFRPPRVSSNPTRKPRCMHGETLSPGTGRSGTNTAVDGSLIFREVWSRILRVSVDTKPDSDRACGLEVSDRQSGAAVQYFENVHPRARAQSLDHACSHRLRPSRHELLF
jgi:hypothetical protein